MKRNRLTAIGAVAMISCFGLSNVASAQSAACDDRVNNNTEKLTECVTVDGVRAHQQALQTIADDNGGIRTSGTPGYDASVDYVVSTLQSAGYDVEIQPFTFNSFIVLGPSTLEQLAPTPTAYVEDVDYTLMSQTEGGTGTGLVTGVDLALADPATSTSGCEIGDFAGFPAGHIALIQRGACAFQTKAENAAASGAVGVIIFNQGNDPSREGLINGTLGAGNTAPIPVVFATYPLGVEWAGTAGLEMTVTTDVFRGEALTFNVLAETTDGNDSNVIMVGAHLDSVNEGAGINDNGSGSAAILEVAVQMAKVKPRNTVRFAWWGAEESGLVGSDFYIFGDGAEGTGLSEEEIADIALYLNFDMVGSPNYVSFIYDGDGSDFGLAGPAGSDVIEGYFEAFYASRGLPSEGTQISFRSDYAAFFDSGIPFGGLFTGAEGIKTAEQEAAYGGTAGEQYDPCYHAACDTFDNVSLEALDVNSDAIAASVLQYAMNTETVNGLRGKGNFATRDSQENLGRRQYR